MQKLFPELTKMFRQYALLALLLLCGLAWCQKLSEERVVFETKFGTIEWAFLPEAAPLTVKHIFKLVTLGGYTTNHFFRVDKGFVAQTADVAGGRTAPMSEELKKEAMKTVPLEVKKDVIHTEGVLSMGRYDDPNSGGSSFSILLGRAAHLDMQYTIFGQVVGGKDVLRKMQTVETRQEGIFVMPKERISIVSSYWYIPNKPFQLKALSETTDVEERHKMADLESRLKAQAKELQKVRAKCLPGS